MTVRPLMWDETLFKDPEVFEIDFVPDEIHFREEQMHELVYQLRPGMTGSRPLNTLVKGVPGTGKTTSIKKVFAEIEESTRRLVPVYVNCQIDNTQFGIFSQIYYRLSGHLPRSTGLSAKRVFDSIGKILERDRTVLVVALDDANYLLYENEINRVLYTLLRSHEVYPDTRIGVITIISDLSVDLMSRIDQRVQSVFRPNEIYFPPYTCVEAKQILSERAGQGFYPNVLPEEVLDLVVDRTMNAGDLRVGIDLLKRAGLNAESAARRVIEEDDVCKAYEVSTSLHLLATIRTFKEEEKVLLRLLAERSLQEGEISIGEFSRSVGDHLPYGYTRIYEMINKFEAMHLIDIRYRGGRGRSRLLTLRYDPAQVLDALK